jgi:hypothetical protein
MGMQKGGRNWKFKCQGNRGHVRQAHDRQFLPLPALNRKKKKKTTLGSAPAQIMGLVFEPGHYHCLPGDV